MRFVHKDCTHYRGSRPCEPHKRTGVVCASCPAYDPVRERVAVIKLGAMGDVLRTTALLPDIRAAHPGAHITWFTEPVSAPLLNGIQVNRVVDTSAPVPAAGMDFDVLYNFDNADDGVALASLLRSKTKRGFEGGRSGKCEGVYPGSDPTLYELGLWDDLKRANTRSYLSLLAATAGLSYSGSPPMVNLSQDDVEVAKTQLSGLPRPCIGINTDAGTRWLRKQWNLPYVEAAAEAFVKDGFGVVLIGGSKLVPFNTALARRFPGRVQCVDTASSVRELFAVIAQLDVLLTGDTLAMHAAWALGTPVVALFGPTSAAEIDLGAGDIKLADTELDCLGCYKHTCDVSPHCMDRLKPDLVVRSVRKRLENSRLVDLV